jgi:phenylalanyl-tRNA synthetase beta chain
MAKIKFSRKEFEKHFKIDDAMKEKISLFGTHLESLSEEEVELEILPNRPDLFSLQGFVRCFKAFLGKETGLKEYKINKPGKDYRVYIDKNLKEIRPYTACAVVKNLKFDEERIKEIIDIQEKIHSTLGRNRKKIAIGIYPLEKISLPINFLAKNPKEIKFQPLEMDRELDGMQILSQHPTGREYAHLLEGKDKFPVFIDSNNEVLSMPPIINSHKTGKITENTKDIFIECSGYELQVLKKALNMLVTMLSDMNGEIYQMKVGDYVTPDLTPERMKLDINNVNKMLGLNLKESEIKKYLERMGYNYSNKIVEIPAYRTDIMHEVDLIEDVAIAYGYENFKPEIPSISTIGEIDKKEEIKKKIAEILTGLDMLELSSYHLLTKEDLANPEQAIEVEDSKSDYKYLKPNLIVSTLKILGENIDAEYPQKVFELGTSFIKDESEETGVREDKSLVIGLTPGNFTELKQVLEYLASMLGLEFKLEEARKKEFIEGRTGKILLGDKEVGIIGEIHPETLKFWKLKMPLVMLEINLENLFDFLADQK